MGNAKRIAGRILDDINLDEMDTSPEHIKGMLKQIDARSAAILRMRFGLDGEEPMTFKAIGERIGMTRDRAHKVVSEALRELGSVISDEAAPMPPGREIIPNPRGLPSVSYQRLDTDSNRVRESMSDKVLLD